MCGRFVLDSPISKIANEFRAEKCLFDIEPSYNIAPSQKIVIVTEEGGKKILQCRWGFIPSWAKDPAVGYKMINARAETVAEKPAFKRAFTNQRCLVIADGFFEWQKTGKKKDPIYIRLKSGRLLGFAGLYSVWTSPEGEHVCTCTIITTEANVLLEPIHDRMPAIIPGEHHDLWLDPAVHDKESLLPLLKPYDADEMEYYRVSSKVNSPANNSADLIEPVSIIQG